MAGSLHAQVAKDLIAAIAAGRFPVGSLLPTELELSESYGASRNTVRSALQELQDLGLISRKRRAGTRVEAASPAVGYRQSIASVEGLMQFGADNSRTIVATETVVAGRALARELGSSAGSRWLHMTSLRQGPDSAEPIGLTDSYLDARHAGLIEEITAFPTVLISTLVEERDGRRIAEIQQDIGAVVLTSAQAKHLFVAPGSPSLRVVRRYLDSAGVAFLITVTLHPAERFTVSLRLRREVEAR